MLDMQERRVLEYVTLGDYQTAVGFLLASTPERSSRFYRDALCTIAMAVSLPIHISRGAYLNIHHSCLLVHTEATCRNSKQNMNISRDLLHRQIY